ncbi:MAG TPA: gluconate 2-dehydrogenase subunit 3 family protein [Steroidobacteraceae bacterium]|nr:gluconate 2-dehydrogenase subunit 3 family protein [Steroidobacteraceae bacterium]
MDRRTTLKWVLAASTAWPLLDVRSARLGVPAAPGYGTDPSLTRDYRPGELWPLTFTTGQRRLAAALADLIIPADPHSPAASTVGVVDFIDEWVSAPYPQGRRDRPVVLDGLAWLDAESTRRFGKDFAALAGAEQRRICDDICAPARAAPERQAPARFFARFRDLTAGAFYSTAAGREDLGYIGNVPLTHFDGPPATLLAKLKLP